MCSHLSTCKGEYASLVGECVCTCGSEHACLVGVCVCVCVCVPCGSVCVCALLLTKEVQLSKT